MIKTVGENQNEMRDLLTKAVDANQKWALNLVRKHGSVAAAVASL